MNARILVPDNRSDYRDLGKRYFSDAHVLDFSETLRKTGRSCYESKKFVHESERMSTSADELAIQLHGEEAGLQPDEMPAFADIFGRNNGGYGMRLHTKTGLRIPRGHPPESYEIINRRKHYIREVLICNTPVGLVHVPESGFVPYSRDFDEVYDRVLGIPRATFGDPHYRHTTYFLLKVPDQHENGKPKIDDVVVGRMSYPLDGERRGLLHITATHPRTDADEDDAIRIVGGLVPRVRRGHEQFGMRQMEEFERMA